MILVSHIREFIFCPRIFYYYNFCNIVPKYQEYVKHGSEFHAYQDELFKSRKFLKFRLNFKKAHKNLYLENEKFCGVLDLVFECDDEIIVVEFKNQSKPILSKGAKMQLIAYSKLASKHFKKPFYRVILCYSNNLKFKIFEIYKEDLAYFDKTLTQIQDLLKKGYFPQSSASITACAQCEFKNYCDDRE